MEQLRRRIRRRGYSRRTEDAYARWVRRYVAFSGMIHPSELGEADVERFLTSLANESQVAASTQNQALSAIVFLYREVLDRELAWLDDIVRAKRPTTVPTVLTPKEVGRVFEHLDGTPKIVALLLYGSGLRLMEALRLRLKDVDLERGELRVWRGKGGRSRVTVLPARWRSVVGDQMARVRDQHERDLGHGAGFVELPSALGAKLRDAGRELRWQWLFPATRTYRHPETREGDGIICTRRSCSARSPERRETRACRSG